MTNNPVKYTGGPLRRNTTKTWICEQLKTTGVALALCTLSHEAPVADYFSKTNNFASILPIIWKWSNVHATKSTSWLSFKAWGEILVHV